MFVYRIVKSQARTNDLSGIGAYKFGGRWNSKGTYMLYTSENSSLAYLESLVHFDELEYPPSLFILKIEIDDNAPVYQLPAKEYPTNWKQPELLKNKALGDELMLAKKHLAIKIKSAINELEYNYLLNPLFPNFNKLVQVKEVKEIIIDARLIK